MEPKYVLILDFFCRLPEYHKADGRRTERIGEL